MLSHVKQSSRCSVNGYIIIIGPLFASVCFQVVVLSTRPLPIMPQRSASEVSFIHNAERKALRGSRRSSLIGWDNSLEDVQVGWRRFLLLLSFHYSFYNDLLLQFESHFTWLELSLDKSSLLKSFVQEDEDDEYDEEKSLMEDTMDQTGNEENDENDDKVLVGKRTHQVSPLLFTKCKYF